MICVIDNYDSFTYNLVQYLGELGAEVQVVRNDAASVDEVAASKPMASTARIVPAVRMRTHSDHRSLRH